MPIPAPASDEIAVAPYGIRAPKPAQKAYKLADALQRIAGDMSIALQENGITPAPNGVIFAAASASARDAHFGIPATATARLALQASGALVVRTDTGQIQRYFAGPTDGGANTIGRTPAGWYAVGVDSLPATVSTQITATKSITATAWALYPDSAWLDLVLPARALVQVNLYGTIGSGAPAASNTNGHLAFRLQGATTHEPGSWQGITGTAPGISSGGSYVRTFDVPAGTLQARPVAYRGVSNIDMRNVGLELTALRFL